MEQLMAKHPLTLPQQDIYFEQIRYPNDPIYNIGAKIEISGDLNVLILQQAYKELIDRNDAFRIILEVENNTPVFIIANEHNTEVAFLDYSDHHEAANEALSFMEAEFKKPFDLESKQFLHKFILIKVSAEFHYLFSVYHHVITDGWGTSLMFQQLVALYNQLMVDGKLETSKTFSYTGFAKDDLNYQAGDDYVDDQTYWTNEFSNLKDALIPIVSKPQNFSHQAELVINRTKYDQLIAVAEQLRISVFHIFMSTLYVYLGRFYQCDDLTIGIPVLNRTNSNYRNTVGLFMGISPIRLFIDFDSTVHALALQVKSKLRQAYRHQRFPVGKLIGALNLHDEREKLYNIMLSYEKHDYAHHFLNTRTRVHPLSHNAERSALSVHIRESDNKEDVRLDIDYNISFITDSHAQHFIRHFEVILDTIISNPNQKIKDLIFHADGFDNYTVQHLAENLILHCYPSDKTVVDLFKETVETHPDRTSVSDAVSTLNYSQLDRESDDMALYIQAVYKDNAPGKPIAVLLDRSVKFAVAVLGVLKSGHSFIPLDPDFPSDRLDYIISDSQCDCLITDRNLAEKFKFPAVIKIFTEDVKASEYIGQIRAPRPQDTAYIIYTSGSTGRPKGVEIGHQSLTNFLWSMKQKPGIIMSDVLYAVTTYSFDISILELFLPLISGASLYIADKKILGNALELIANLKRIAPSIIQATPSFFQMLFNAGWRGDHRLKILCGGDLLNKALTEKLIQASHEVWNMYGPTETTIWSSIKQIFTPQDFNNIGQAINNTAILLLDQWMNPVPIGAVGNLYIGGSGLSKGYYKNDKLTNERFISLGGRLYDTGDLGKWNDNKEIEFVGRRDSQVKIRGYRIELGEIEECLLSKEDISEAVVIAKSLDGIKILAAYIKLTNVVFDDEDVRDYLRTRLPEYMVPAIIIRVNSFPVTPNNKIDRRALINDVTITTEPPVISAPENEIEQQILELWKDCLKLNIISVNDNFFKIGGHSLSAVRLVYQLNEHFGSSLSQSDIFHYPTIRLLGEKIKQSGSSFLSTAFTIADRQSTFELTYVQQTIWTLAQRKEASIAYHMNAVYEVQGSINIGLLTKAVTNCIERHESLRTNFVEIAGAPKQKIRDYDSVDFQINCLNVAGIEELNREIDAMLYKVFKLENDLLLRMSVIKTSEGNQYLLFSIHHIIMDGWSLEILITEIMTGYNQMTNHENPDITIPEIQFKDYAQWLNRKNADLKAKEYWESLLRGYQFKHSFKRSFRDREDSFNGGQISFGLGEDESILMRNSAQEAAVTVFGLTVALLTTFIHRSSGHEDICIGMVTSGRTIKESLTCIGMFANTLPLRFSVKPEDSFDKLSREVNDLILKGYQFADYQVAELYTGNSQPFDLIIAFQNPDFSVNQVEGFKDFKITPYPYEHKYSRFPLTFNFYNDRSANLICDIEYNKDYYSGAAVEILALRFKDFIIRLLQNRTSAIHAFDVISTAEKEINSDAEISFNF